LTGEEIYYYVNPALPKLLNLKFSDRILTVKLVERGGEMKNLLKLKSVLLLLGLITFGLQAPTWAATTFDLFGVNYPDQVAASVNFAYNSGSGQIDLSLTNNSDYDARLTGFAFNVPDSVTGVSSFTGPSGWAESFDPDNISTPGQFGKFDLAGLTGPNLNGGDPNDGIPPASTFNFTFVLAGAGLDGLNENSFLGLLSDPGKNDDLQSFIARFQRVGPDGEGSDVAVVPIPATLLLFGSGLTGLLLIRRRLS